MQTKKSHKPVKFLQLSEEKKHEQTFNLPSLLFSRLTKGVQTVKKHSSVLLHPWHAMDHITTSLTMQLTSGVGVFAHVSVAHVGHFEQLLC